MSETPTSNDLNSSGMVTVLLKHADCLHVDTVSAEHRWFRGEFREYEKDGDIVLYGWIPGNRGPGFLKWHEDIIASVLTRGGTIDGGHVLKEGPTVVEPNKRKLRIDETIPILS